MDINLDIEQVIINANDTAMDYNHKITVQEIFQQQVERTPNNIAIQFEDESLTYRQFDQKTNALAWKLREHGIKPDQVVGIIADRSIEMLIGIFAIVKSGAAYLPLNPLTPIKRNEFQLVESACNILLITDHYQNILTFTGVTINLNNPENYRGKQENLPLINGSDNLVYVIYTSGSTGNPKGIMVEHRSLVNRIEWMQRKYPISQDDVLLQKTYISFDVSVWELFWWSFTGASLCILQPHMERFPQAISQCIERYKVSVIHFVPSMFGLYLQSIADVSEDLNKTSSLRYVFTSGEALKAEHVKAFNHLLYKHHGTRLINLYGPTEATIDVTYYDCPVDGEIKVVPIGKPIDNTKIIIVDHGKMQPVNEAGEICLIGDGLARGYLNRPDLTEECFVPSLLAGTERMYKTGDWGKWLPDGNIQYLGRIDFQVKIRGVRIELQEIESSINSYQTGVKSVVLTNQVSDTVVQIIAVIETRDSVDLPGMKKYLQTVLPVPMLPNKYHFIDQIPITAHGKADRKKLEQEFCQ